MQVISDDFKRFLSNRLKVGELGKPRCRVEVDKLAFIPGKIEKLVLDDFTLETEVTVEKHWILPNADGSYSGGTNTVYEDITFPVQGLTYENLTSGYGMRGGKMHNGVDFAPSASQFPKRGMGLPVVAVWDGKVSAVTESNSYGKYIDIVHGNGKRTRYAHLINFSVTTGQEVLAGQKIGEMGNTGNVRSGGEAVTGSYANPNSPRSQGLGTHLHFEIHEPIGPGNFKKVNPEDYFKGKIKSTKPSVSQGDGSMVEGSIKGIPGRIVLNESFVLKNWHENKRYSFADGFLKYSSTELYQVGGISNWNTIKFPTSGRAPKVKTSMTINLNLVSDGFLDLSFRSNFDASKGDGFYITINDSERRSANILRFDGLDKVQEIKQIHVPKGDVKITIGVDWGGTVATGGPSNSGKLARQLSIGKIKVQELAVTSEMIKEMQKDYGFDDTQEDFYNLQNGYWEEREITDFIFSQTPQTFDLTVGDFVYSETIVLDNVMTVDIAGSFEQDTSEATIVLSNKGGYYGPEYNPYYFPGSESSPFSTQMAGFQVGVLSNNTPIRIYMGYGNNLIRVFTGLIDKVDLASSPSTITLTARDMYKKISDKVLTETKKYPDINYIEDVPGEGGELDLNKEPEKVAWLKSAVVQDLIDHAGMFGWRAHAEDLQYPDAVIEESYLISIDQLEGTFVRAVPGEEGAFEVAKLSSIPTPKGWMNPYTDEYGRTFEQYQYRVGECISEVLRDTHYRSYCDRYGTYRLETPDYYKEIADQYVYGINLLPIEKTIDFSRARSHIIVKDENGIMSSFMDKEILMEVKSEVRTASVEVPWAKTYALKKVVAARLFQDMKRICRTLQVATPCNPALDILDRVMIIDRNTSTNAVYTIKGLRRSYSVNDGLVQFLELFWSEDGTVY